ncbi:MAG TPA: hypothetical protein VE046_10410 [Steroidobacteraceae bacterium]|nr:hypothetical protein [Steroidobacteraceae bacterium]
MTRDSGGLAFAPPAGASTAGGAELAAFKAAIRAQYDMKEKPFAIQFRWAKVDGRWMGKGDFFGNGNLRTGKLTPPPAPPAP